MVAVEVLWMAAPLLLRLCFVGGFGSVALFGDFGGVLKHLNFSGS
jgi:hypothetical protein